MGINREYGGNKMYATSCIRRNNTYIQGGEFSSRCTGK